MDNTSPNAFYFGDNLDILRQRSAMTTHSLPNYFETFVGKLFKDLGCQIVEEQPHIGNKKSDFLAATPDGEKFYIEATVIQPEQIKESPNEIDVCTKLNTMCNNPGIYRFHAFVVVGELYQPIPKKNLSCIKEWVEGLSSSKPTAVSKRFDFPSGTPPKNIKNPTQKWSIEISADPRPENGQGVPAPLLASIGKSGGIDSVNPLLRKVRDKAKQHKSVEAPLLLAIDDVALFSSDHIDIALALFGWQQDVRKGVSCITPRYEKMRQSSLWGKGKNTTISAILFFSGLTPNTEQHTQTCLYENPNARYPISNWLKNTFPLARIEEEAGLQFLHHPPEQSLNSVRGLPEEPRPYAETERKLNESMPCLFRNRFNQ